MKLVKHLRNKLDVKIILLVRDPRSIAASRFEIYKGRGLIESTSLRLRLSVPSLLRRVLLSRVRKKINLALSR